jgi:hypothetical protein
MNGGVIGAVNLPTVNSASGVWSIEEVKLAQQQDIWPPLLTPDPYWEYVSLLLSSETATTNGAQNNTFLDSSTNNFSITRNGNTTQGSFNPFGSNWSGYFDGGSNRLTTDTSSQFNLSGIDFTIEFFLYASALPASEQNRLITIGPNDAQSSFLIAINPNGSIAASVPFSTGGSVTSGINALSLSTWTHVAFTLSSNTGSLYINGIRVAATSGWNISSSNNNYFYIGYDATATVSARYTGFVSNVRFVVGTEVYSGSTITVPTEPLAAISGTRYLNLQNNSAVDNSANNFSIGTTGTVSFMKFSPFNFTYQNSFSYGAYFDGTGDYLTIPYSTSTVQWWDTDYTLEMWVYNQENRQSAVNDLSLQISYGNPLAADTYWAFGTNGTGRLYFYYFNGSPVTDAASPVGTVVPLNTWTHIALVYNNTTGFINGYINGTSVFSVAKQGTPQGAPGFTLNIGVSQNVSYKGYISNLRIVRGTAVYTSNFTPPTTQLTAITGTTLLICQSSTFIDNSTNNFTITPNGDTKPTTFSPFTNTYTSLPYNASILGASGYFDGSGDYLTIAQNSALLFGSENFTVEAWCYITTLDRPIVGFWSNTSGANQSWLLSAGPTGFFDFSIQGDQGAEDLIILSASGARLNQWIHVAVTRSGSSWRMFINGTLSSSGTYSGTLATPGNNLTIGTVENGSVYKGCISGLRIVKGTAVYTSNFTPLSSPLTAVANTSLLLNFANAGILDSSTINDLETVDNAQISTEVKKYGTGSVYFDGTGDRLVGPTNPVNEIGSGNWTCEFWVNAASFSAVQIFTSYEAASGTTYGIFSWVVYCNGGKFGLDVSTGSSSLFGILSNSDVPTNTWTHLAVTRSGNTCRLFINGTLDASSTSFTGTPYVPANSFLFVGGAVRGFPFTGYISDLRITKGVARYTTNFTPPTSPLPAF